ncbi:MAG: hypothetical protein FJX80_03400 [Bacteroidetes bacterium]|nr:hypothetical protein [Bacteroidota bacterium]
MSNENIMSTDDIMVFSFAKDSQFNHRFKTEKGYAYVYTVLNRLLQEHGVNTPKIGIGGYVEDVAAYISFIIHSYQLHHSINSVEVADFDPAEFDPEPIKFSPDQGADQAQVD